MRKGNQNETAASGSDTAKKGPTQQKQTIRNKESKENVPRKRIQIDEINEDEVSLLY